MFLENRELLYNPDATYNSCFFDEQGELCVPEEEYEKAAADYKKQKLVDTKAAWDAYINRKGVMTDPKRGVKNTRQIIDFKKRAVSFLGSALFSDKKNYNRFKS